MLLLLLFALAWLAVASELATIKISRLLYVRVDLPGFVFAGAIPLLAAFLAWRLPPRLFTFAAHPEA